MTARDTSASEHADSRILAHPGEVLREEFLVPLGLSPQDLAQALRVPATRINDIVRGRGAVTADTALRLARYLGTTPEFWLEFQVAHDLSKARVESGEEIDRLVEPRKA